MIVYFLADLFLNNIFGLASYFTIGSLSKINKSNCLYFLIIAIFYDIYIFMDLFYYLVIFIIIGVIKSKSSFINYAIFFAYNILFISYKSIGNYIYLIFLWALLYKGFDHIVDRINIYIKR